MTGIECFRNIGWHRRLQCRRKGTVCVCVQCARNGIIDHFGCGFQAFFLCVFSLLVEWLLDAYRFVLQQNAKTIIKIVWRNEINAHRAHHIIPASFGCWWNFGVWQWRAVVHKDSQVLRLPHSSSPSTLTIWNYYLLVYSVTSRRWSNNIFSGCQWTKRAFMRRTIEVTEKRNQANGNGHQQETNRKKK